MADVDRKKDFERMLCPWLLADAGDYIFLSFSGGMISYCYLN